MAVCFVLAASFGHAQTLPSETDGNPNEVLGPVNAGTALAEPRPSFELARVTGVDPAYLMALADKESSLLPDNKARTSSAEGLFQFIESTWLEGLRRYGPKHGWFKARTSGCSWALQRCRAASATASAGRELRKSALAAAAVHCIH